MSGKKLVMINGNQFGYSAGHYYYCKYLNKEFRITCVCFDRGLKKIELENVNIIYVPYYNSKIKRNIEFLKTSIKTCNRINPDILYVVYFYLSAIIPLLTKHKISVLDIRTGSLLKNAIKRKFCNFNILVQSWFFKKNIILSESLRIKIGIKKNNTLILPLGSEVYFSGDHDFNRLHLLYVGALDGRNISDTIEGLGNYLKKYPERKDQTKYTLIGFGSSNEISKINQAINENNLSDVVNYEGRKNYNELGYFFSLANIGVSYIPITKYYNYQPPTKTFEYIINGLFTIATGTHENKQIVNSTNGIICSDNSQSFSNILEEVYSNRNYFNSSIIRDTLKDYTWFSLVKNKLLVFLK